MNNQLLQQQIGVTCFLVVISTLAVSNLFMFRRLDRYRESTHKPFVSVLLPMRNEETNAEACIRSLLSQEYEAFELLVLDDESVDGTWTVVSRLAAEGPRMIVIKGLPLPNGWLGKHWACHQLAMAAKGEILLFADADTRHSPDSLAAGVNALIAEGADMVTAFPREEMLTAGEKAGIPILAFSFLAFMPLILAYRRRPRSFAVAIGQYMLFRRESYFAVGGHEAVKDEVLDDFALAKTSRRRGCAGFSLTDGDRCAAGCTSGGVRFTGAWERTYSPFLDTTRPPFFHMAVDAHGIRRTSRAPCPRLEGNVIPVTDAARGGQYRARPFPLASHRAPLPLSSLSSAALPALGQQRRRNVLLFHVDHGIREMVLERQEAGQEEIPLAVGLG